MSQSNGAREETKNPSDKPSLRCAEPVTFFSSTAFSRPISGQKPFNSFLGPRPPGFRCAGIESGQLRLRDCWATSYAKIQHLFSL